MSAQHDMRQRIYNALQAHYSHSALIEGMQIWEKDFAHRRRFSQRQFALVMSRQLKPGVDYNEVLASIINAMNSDKENLLELPKDFGNLKSKTTSPEAHTFSVLLSFISAGMQELPDSIKFNQIFELLIEKNLSPELVSALLKNLRQSKALVLIRLRSMESYRRVINALYVGLCEIYGPVDSDKILSDAVKKTDLTQSGKLFSARNFL